MKFLAIESLQISLKLNISAARERQSVGLGPFNVVASWVMACEYLSLGLHVGNHSSPTPLTIIFYLFCSPTMERSEVLNIGDTAIARNNDSLVDSMKRILNESLSDIKRANSESADSHLREIKKLRFEERMQQARSLEGAVSVANFQATCRAMTSRPRGRARSRCSFF